MAKTTIEYNNQTIADADNPTDIIMKTRGKKMLSDVIVRGTGGGGSNLPAVTSEDVGAVLGVVDNNGTPEWNKALCVPVTDLSADPIVDIPFTITDVTGTLTEPGSGEPLTFVKIGSAVSVDDLTGKYIVLDPTHPDFPRVPAVGPIDADMMHDLSDSGYLGSGYYVGDPDAWFIDFITLPAEPDAAYDIPEPGVYIPEDMIMSDISPLAGLGHPGTSNAVPHPIIVGTVDLEDGFSPLPEGVIYLLVDPEE